MKWCSGAALLPSAKKPLSCSIYGDFPCQKLLEYCNENERIVLIERERFSRPFRSATPTKERPSNRRTRYGSDYIGRRPYAINVGGNRQAGVERIGTTAFHKHRSRKESANMCPPPALEKALGSGNNAPITLANADDGTRAGS